MREKTDRKCWKSCLHQKCLKIPLWDLLLLHCSQCASSLLTETDQQRMIVKNRSQTRVWDERLMKNGWCGRSERWSCIVGDMSQFVAGFAALKTMPDTSQTTSVSSLSDTLSQVRGWLLCCVRAHPIKRGDQMNAESMAGDIFSEGALNSINTLVNCSVLSQDLLCFKVLNLLILAGVRQHY